MDCQGRAENGEHGPVFFKDKHGNGAYAIEEELPLDDVRERVQRRELGVGGHEDCFGFAALRTAGAAARQPKNLPAAEFKSIQRIRYSNSMTCH